jgi:hypothetical protein
MKWYNFPTQCLVGMVLLSALSSSAQTPSGKMTLQGSDDPLLAIDHTGTTGNPAIWIQQDGADKAYLWWDQVNNRLNLGTPVVNPIASFQNNGSRLEIFAQDGLAITGFQPFLTLRDTNPPVAGARSILAGGNGDFGFYPNSFIGGFPAVIIKNGTGNIGIGIPNPTRKLEVAGTIRSSSGGFVFPDGTTQTTATLRGPQGPRGPAGPPGPATRTSAVCVGGGSPQQCSCSNRTVSFVLSDCTVTSDTGSCSATSAGIPGNIQHGSCCVCAP